MIIASQHGQISYGIVHYVIDEEREVAFLPTKVSPASTCEVIETGNIYILNNKLQWVLKKIKGGSETIEVYNSFGDDTEGAISQDFFTKQTLGLIQENAETKEILSYKGEIIPLEGETPLDALRRAVESPRLGDLAKVGDAYYVCGLDASTGEKTWYETDSSTSIFLTRNEGQKLVLRWEPIAEGGESET